MGTKFVPVDTTLTIGCLEEKTSVEVKALFGNEFENYFIKNWKSVWMTALCYGHGTVHGSITQYFK